MSTVKYCKKWDRAKIAVDDRRDDKGEGTMIITVRPSIWERVKLLFTGIFVVEVPILAPEIQEFIEQIDAIAKDCGQLAKTHHCFAHAEEFKKDNAAEIERLNQSAKDQCQS